MFSDDLNHTEDMQHNPWPAIRIVAEEIIFSELLTRVWSAVIAQSESKKPGDDLSAIAHSVLIGHIESRNRVFQLLLQIPKWAEPTAENINRMRRVTERWTDLLLSQLPDSSVSAAFAFDEKRMREFHRDQKMMNIPERRQANNLLAGSLSADLKRVGSRFPANPDLNRKIAAGIMACYPRDPFAAGSFSQSTWSVQIESLQTNAQMLIDQLLQSDQKKVRRGLRRFSKN
jgi:hypothetical protein